MTHPRDTTRAIVGLLCDAFSVDGTCIRTTDNARGDFRIDESGGCRIACNGSVYGGYTHTIHSIYIEKYEQIAEMTNQL
jgi:hypothetical protein